MKIIYKYPLQIIVNQTLFIPLDSEILSVGVQNDKLQVWVLIDKNEKMEKMNDGYEVLVLGTGNFINPNLNEFKFFGTHMMYEGKLVWHIYIKKI